MPCHLRVKCGQSNDRENGELPICTDASFVSIFASSSLRARYETLSRLIFATARIFRRVPSTYPRLSPVRNALRAISVSSLPSLLRKPRRVSREETVKRAYSRPVRARTIRRCLIIADLSVIHEYYAFTVRTSSSSLRRRRSTNRDNVRPSFSRLRR